jgi:MerR family redox-sensitive transcriptional activator SoxR
VRFYERHGLVTAYRTSGNQRRFAPEAVCRIKMARVAQRVGLTVREIAEVLDELPEDSVAEDWARVGERLVEEGRARIRRLERAVTDIASSELLCDIEPRIEA